VSERGGVKDVMTTRHVPFLLTAAICAVVLGWIPHEAGALPFGNCEPEFVDLVKAEKVASNMSHNAIRQSISRIESKEIRGKVIKAYQNKWRSTHAEPLDALVVKSGNWEIVSKLIGTCLHTVQLDTRSNSASGYVSARNLGNEGQTYPVVLGKNIAKPYGSEVLSDISHDDPGKKARTLMIATKFSVDANAEFYIRNFGNEGWRVLNDHNVPLQKRQQAARAVTFGKGHEQHIVVITESQSGSNVVVQWMERP